MQGEETKHDLCKFFGLVNIYPYEHFIKYHSYVEFCEEQLLSERSFSNLLFSRVVTVFFATYFKKIDFEAHNPRPLEQNAPLGSYWTFGIFIRESLRDICEIRPFRW